VRYRHIFFSGIYQHKKSFHVFVLLAKKLHSHFVERKRRFLKDIPFTKTGECVCVVTHNTLYYFKPKNCSLFGFPTGTNLEFLRKKK